MVKITQFRLLCAESFEGIYNGIGIPAVEPFEPSVFGYDESVSGISYDIEAAKELLAETGYEYDLKQQSEQNIMNSVLKQTLKQDKHYLVKHKKCL
ncbi:hypothetical protein [Oceanobacillus sp. FSL H7-0719]|uniref:hypothetical protein n=1 Tax=Oceanobacillus sp. FSL H7-0719 TaxID=2954507 RepID=UPI0032449039